MIFYTNKIINSAAKNQTSYDNHAPKCRNEKLNLTHAKHKALRAIPMKVSSGAAAAAAAVDDF